ncbi:segment polarity protein dishevelled homolog DVL-3-like [Rhineura floridana]|uniref:segment polarity protein dishevelled homolog DVL-3-like n=1 Tax=Rhineura floridana TaxID=261503 RepID=UPI002AC8693A|nr:segment polarity protein dishevelled homolog DVL-3-like [Rhineura floridana]
MTSELQTARSGLSRRCPPRRAAAATAVVETKIIYHLDNQEKQYLVKLLIPAERVTLGDFKALLNRPNYKFYFKSTDDDFGQESDGVSEQILYNSCSMFED